MINHSSLADFIKGLRRDKLSTQWICKMRFSHMCLRPYKTNKQEAALLAGILEKGIANVNTLEQLKRRLVYEDIPNNNKLVDLATKLYRNYSSYAGKEPAVFRQFNRIRSLLNPLIGVVNANRNQERELLRKIGLMLSGQPGVEKLPTVYSEDVDRLINLRERYSTLLQRNHEAFNNILREELDDKPGIRLTSGVHEDLLKMTHLMERAVFHAESTKLELIKWQKRLARLEKLELLN